MGPKTNYVELWAHQMTSNNIRSCSKDVILEILNPRKPFLGKRRVPNNPWDPSNKLLKTLNMKSISFKNHEMSFCQFSIQSKELKQLKVISFSIKGPPPNSVSHPCISPPCAASAHLHRKRNEGTYLRLLKGSWRPHPIPTGMGVATIRFVVNRMKCWDVV